MARRPIHRQQPFDRGWSWLVCMACCVIRFLLNGFWTSMGLFFLVWEEQFATDASSISVIGSIVISQWLMGPFASSLAHRITHRTITFVSGLIVSSSLIVATFAAHDIQHLYVIMAITAIGLGFPWYISGIYCTYYFKTKIGLANSLLTGFAAAGTLVLPIFFQKSLKEYGWRGTFLVTAGIMCNICSFALFLRPAMSGQDKFAETSAQTTPVLTNCNIYTKLKFYLCKCASNLNLNLFCKNIQFWSTCLLGLGNGLAFTPLFVYIAPHAKRLGINELKSAFLLSIMGICSLALRFSVGIIVDKKLISCWKFYAIFLVICAITCFTLPIYGSFAYLAVLSAICGASDGGVEALYLLVLIDLSGDAGNDGAAVSFAWGNTLWAIGGVVSVYFGGFLCDETGSYNPIFLFAGGVLVFEAIVTLSRNGIQKLQWKMENSGGIFCWELNNNVDHEMQLQTDNYKPLTQTIVGKEMVIEQYETTV